MTRPDHATAAPVRAAGTVLWRPAAGGRRADPSTGTYPGDGTGTSTSTGTGTSTSTSTGTGTGTDTGDGIEIAVIHRPRYDDWSLPKGKVKRGEDLAAAAVRETREETGHRCVLGTALRTLRYAVENGRAKEVRYWSAQAGAGRFAPGDEVDRLEWLDPDAARRRLTYDHDRPLIDALLAALRA